VQESPDHKDVAAPDDLSVVLGFTQMLSDGGNVDEVSRLATDHGWLDASGQLTAAGNQLARALLQQTERERYFVFGESLPSRFSRSSTTLTRDGRSQWPLLKEGRTEH
jgi:hypothetical protein